jgi:hypothetical protein
LLCRSDRLRSVWVAFVLSALVLMEPHTVMAQYSNDSSGAQQVPAQGGGSQAVRGSSGGSSIRVVPTLSVSERYDSNIFAGAGRQASDFVTDIRPGARVNYSSDLVEGTFSGSAMSGIYARNPELNYVGANVAFNAILDKMTERVIRGFKLNLTEAATYYPEQPGFVTPDSPESDFTRGIQARRNNSLTNNTTAQGSYEMTPLTQLNVNYSFQTRRFIGNPSSNDPSTPIPQFNNTVHSISAGPMYQISPAHSVGTSYVYRQMTFGTTTGASASSTSVIHGGMVTWRSALSRELTAELSPGVSILTSSPDRPIIWTMRAGFRWQDRRVAGSIFYTRGTFPSYLAQATVLVSNLVTATFTYTVSDQWSVGLGANYALNTQADQGSLQFKSIGINGTIRYSFYPGMSLSVIGSHGDFTIDQPGVSLNYDRQTGIVALTAEWN